MKHRSEILSRGNKHMAVNPYFPSVYQLVNDKMALFASNSCGLCCINGHQVEWRNWANIGGGPLRCADYRLPKPAETAPLTAPWTACCQPKSAIRISKYLTQELLKKRMRNRPPFMSWSFKPIDHYTNISYGLIILAATSCIYNLLHCLMLFILTLKFQKLFYTRDTKSLFKEWYSTEAVFYFLLMRSLPFWI